MATTTSPEPNALVPVPGTGTHRVVPTALSRLLHRYPVLFAQLRGFGVVAVICTVVSVIIFAALRPSTGTQWANAISLILCSVLNTELNRRISFGVQGMHFWWRDQRRGLWIMLLALAMTSGSLWVLHEVRPDASIAAELIVIIFGNVTSAVTRFLLLRYWIFRRLRKNSSSILEH
ncbi:GtrA family protein [Arthrobacter cryoconiti]|uniref:GtrA family protein n=1 Tax=Arthrobacter cryoconiti TaxID=748907 RepID=A0ABV8QVY2_9MICC|nr:GtrA family protein [Arthrobacter cryoconiti]MCC9068882.1 GtrA family protein [Arthrobacter cryoconiti]